MDEPGAIRATPDTASDLDVVARIRQGDGASFELIMRRYNRRLYRIARGILRNEAEAEDAVQEAYVRAYQKLDRFEGKGPLSAWLARITVNEALGRLRAAAVVNNSISLDDPERGEGANYMAELTFPGPSPEQDAARGEFRRMLEVAIDALPDVYRLVFVLRGLEELSVAETADCLELEQATVKTRYHRARKILQEHLAGLVQATAGEAFPFAGERCDRIVAGVLRRLGIRGQR
ncbi:RNA polymerase sigma factor [Desulfuromonas versatilis]|uniref:RNA polymerase sigma factor n=1 Tax=Desulfuromonas versatilis TaxID=2802975 RepID=A0ABM8HWC6_9BACT|nr:RNA polymerase sigma factor [Desulfuromonas versatilis]BCR04874.1 RNA polymerase sigma factor [Desulfuromonas versatilis]